MSLGSPLTLSLSFTAVTAEPTFATPLENSCPGINGGFTSKEPPSPLKMCISVPHTPQYFTYIMTSFSFNSLYFFYPQVMDSMIYCCFQTRFSLFYLSACASFINWPVFSSDNSRIQRRVQARFPEQYPESRYSDS